MTEFAGVTDGVLVDHQLQRLIADGTVFACDAMPIVTEQVQPASFDLRLGQVAYRVQAGVLPGKGRTLKDRLTPLMMAELDLSKPQMLERGAVYVVPLAEGLKLSEGLAGTVSPKSSTGRLDIFVRLVTDGASTYDTIAAGYQGPLYLEIMPLTFPIIVRAGDRLNQLRLRKGHPACSDQDVVAHHHATPLAYSKDGLPETDMHVANGLWTSIDLQGNGDPEAIVGYKAKHHTQAIDLQKIGHYHWRDFWEPIYASSCKPLILQPNDFYIFVSLERLSLPAHLSAELVAYDTQVGELRVHYAGFFDPGFGYVNDKKGTPAVLEVRAHDVPFMVEHGQRIGRFVYEKLSDKPQALYGAAIGSNYAQQELKLAKQFRM